MKVLSFISSGNGNAIQHVPSLKKLKAKGHTVHGIFDSIYHCEELFDKSAIFDKKLLFKSYLNLARFLLKKNAYDIVYLDSYALRRRNFYLAKWLGKKVVCQHRNPGLIKRYGAKGINEIKPQSSILSELYGVSSEKPVFSFQAKPNTENYMVFQPGVGHLRTPWKVYPTDKWVTVLSKVQIPIKIIGDHHEKKLIEICRQIPNAEILIGQTTVSEMKDIVSKANLFVGHDSGPMHIAHAFGIPCFIVWGGSNKTIYSYNFIKSNSYKTIQHPDHSDLATETPFERTDYKLIQQIDPSYVKEELIIFSQNLGIQLYA